MKKGIVIWEKRGLSHHIEMTVSFVLFIGFVFFVLIFVRPYDNNFLTGSVVEGLHYNFIENAKSDVLTVFIDVDDYDDLDPPGDCFKINTSSIPYEGSFNSTMVLRLNYTRVASNRPANAKEVWIGEVNNNSYYVHFSNFYDNLISGCTEETDYNYSFGSVNHERILTEKGLRTLQQEYYRDYEGLRTKLTVPEVFDYGISTDMLNVSMENNQNSLEVISKDYIEKVLMDDGRIKYVRFSFKLW